ncbi:hypothetical protein EalM132_00037 [Exiguobacterium phage vB_EalM-132]|nr:hypothetical protein EalM132_00037 [Exiguobacterium phage vB_EalM-132]
MQIQLVPHPTFSNTFHCMRNGQRIATLQQNMNGAIPPLGTTYFVIWNSLVVPQYLRINRNMSMTDLIEFIAKHLEELNLVR